MWSVWLSKRYQQLKGNFSIFEPGIFSPMFLCLINLSIPPQLSFHISNVLYPSMRLQLSSAGTGEAVRGISGSGWRRCCCCLARSSLPPDCASKAAAKPDQGLSTVGWAARGISIYWDCFITGYKLLAVTLNISPLLCFCTVGVHLMRTVSEYTWTVLETTFLSGPRHRSAYCSQVRHTVFTLIKQTGLWGQVYWDPGLGRWCKSPLNQWFPTGET